VFGFIVLLVGYGLWIVFIHEIAILSLFWLTSLNLSPRELLLLSAVWIKSLPSLSFFIVVYLDRAGAL